VGIGIDLSPPTRYSGTNTTYKDHTQNNTSGHTTNDDRVPTTIQPGRAGRHTHQLACLSFPRHLLFYICYGMYIESECRFRYWHVLVLAHLRERCLDFVFSPPSPYFFLNFNFNLRSPYTRIHIRISKLMPPYIFDAKDWLTAEISDCWFKKSFLGETGTCGYA
jgi:hypothetical protein